MTERSTTERAPLQLTITPLGASATQYYPSSDGQDRLGSTGLWSHVRAMGWSDEAGTLTLQGSDDRVTWSTIGSALTFTADVINTFDWTALTYRYWRWKFVNGGTQQTLFRLYEDKVPDTSLGSDPQAVVVTGGTVAHDAPSTANPVLTGFVAESTTPAAVADGDLSQQAGTLYGAAFVNLRTAAGGEYALVNTNQQVVTLKDTSGVAHQTVSGNGDANGPTANGILVSNYEMLYNSGSDTWQRKRNNHTATPFTSAARTATASSSDQTLYNGKGVRLTINVTAVTATPSVVFTVEVKDSVSGTYTTILTSAAITGTGTTTLRIHPGMLAVANLVADDLLARTWRITATHADADSITYSVSADVMV